MISHGDRGRKRIRREVRPAGDGLEDRAAPSSGFAGAAFAVSPWGGTTSPVRLDSGSGSGSGPGPVRATVVGFSNVGVGTQRLGVRAVPVNAAPQAKVAPRLMAVRPFGGAGAFRPVTGVPNFGVRPTPAPPPLPAPAPAPAPVVPLLNARVLEAARGLTGQSVGRGECTDLAIEALRSSGARGFSHGPGGAIMWGDLVTTLSVGARDASRIAPGDVLQFKDATFQGRTSSGGTYWSSAAQHTAIVTEVSGNVVKVLEQNANGRRSVGAGEYRMGDLTGGTVSVYRPVAV